MPEAIERAVIRARGVLVVVEIAEVMRLALLPRADRNLRMPPLWGGRGSITTDSVAVTRQQTATGSQITGTVSVRISASSGDSCNGTYAVDYLRQ